MSETLERILDLVSRHEVRISLHGYEELAADGILVKDVLAGVGEGVVVEDYPDYPKGPSSLITSANRSTSSGVSREVQRAPRSW